VLVTTPLDYPAGPARSIFGMSIKVDYSGALPVDPTPAEEARRIVRHGMKDVLEWLGERVGPRPKAATHAVVFRNAMGRADEVMVSPELSERMMREISILGPSTALAGPIYAAKRRIEFRYRDGDDSEPVCLPDTPEETAKRRLLWAREVLDRHEVMGHLGRFLPTIPVDPFKEIP